MKRTRHPVLMAGVTVAVAALVLSGTPVSLAGTPETAGDAARGQLRADLDGRPMRLAEVGDHYCHDFDYPAIHCFTHPDALESSFATVLAATSSTITYATVYDYTAFQGSYLHMSQNYTVLALIGWNDRISSLIVKNYEYGNFYADWFYGGTVFPFCCNQALANLYSFNNTFSSVYRF